MDMLPFLAAGLVAIILVVVAILLLRRAEEDPLAQRIDEFAAREEPSTIEDIELSLPITDRIVVPILRKLSEEYLSPAGISRQPRQYFGGRVLGDSWCYHHWPGRVDLFLPWKVRRHQQRS